MIYFTSALLIFSLITCIIFAILFSSYSEEVHKKEIETKALNISNSLSKFMNENSKDNILKKCDMHSQNECFECYTRFLNDIITEDIWIVNSDKKIIRGNGNIEIYYQNLPEGTEDSVDKIFQGDTLFTESFSKQLNKQSITIGVPVYNSDNNIVAAILVHSSIENVSSLVKGVFYLLISSIIISLIIAFIVSVMLSVNFTRPLNKMKNTAIKLSEGNYNVKTEINQSDEIGQLADAIDSLSDKLIKASQESQALENMRRNFIANVSHELRTPITVIRGSLEALCDNIIEDKEMVMQYYNQMLNESIHLQRLVNDLLELSKLQNINFKTEKLEIDLYKLIKELIKNVEKTVSLKNVKIVFKSNNENFIVFGDYKYIKQMINIIIDNAIKFSPENEKIIIYLNKINTINLSITDYGQGIEEYDIPYIFDRFYKTKSKENKEGTGLGLPIARQIAQIYNIEIFVKSIKDKYTTFLFVFNNIKI